MNEQIKKERVNPATDADRIDRVLASEEPIVPSSGFLAAVMERIEDESRTPAPIPFPWKRATLAVPLVAGVFGWGAYGLIRFGVPSLGSVPLPQVHLTTAPSAPLDQAVWVGLAFVASFLSWKLARRITGQS